MAFVDMHSHLADPRFDSDQDSSRKEILKEAKVAGIGLFIQAGVGPEDWQRQEELAIKFPEILPVFGLHPYWIKSHTFEECEQALDLLAKKLPRLSAVGEMGLDLRSDYKDCESLQIEVFERQLELAIFSNKPVVLHLVRSHDQALKILDTWGLPKSLGFVHAFNGSAKKAKDFLALGLNISIGGAICWEQNKALHQAVAAIPLERLLVESDAPDQAPPSFEGGLNRPICIIQVAEKIAEIKGVPAREILDITSQNARQLLSI